MQWLIRRPGAGGDHPCPAPPTTVFQATAGAHLKDGVLHITNLYAGAVIGWFAGEERFEPEQEDKRGERATHTHVHSSPEAALPPLPTLAHDKAV